MTFPKIEYPTFEIYLKSLDRKVKFRPFLVREEKLLLIAKESEDTNEIRNSIVQIINNCVIDKLDVLDLPMFDIEMIFLTLRSKSVGESVKLIFNCQNEVDGVPCNTDTEYKLNLTKVRYEIPEGHNSKIMITDTIGMKLNYPTLADSNALSEESLDNEPFAIFLDMLMNNIDYVFDKESMWKPDDVPREELETFVNNLTVEKLEQIKNFFRTSPQVVLEDSVNCSKCGFVHNIHSEGLLSFFI
jgi:hypothetical protein